MLNQCVKWALWSSSEIEHFWQFNQRPREEAQRNVVIRRTSVQHTREHHDIVKFSRHSSDTCMSLFLTDVHMCFISICHHKVNNSKGYFLFPTIKRWIGHQKLRWEAQWRTRKTKYATPWWPWMRKVVVVFTSFESADTVLPDRLVTDWLRLVQDLFYSLVLKPKRFSTTPIKFF